MKIRIIKDIDGLKAGDEITLNGHPPATWAGHYEVPTGKVEAPKPETHPLDRDGDGRKGGSLPKGGDLPKGKGGALGDKVNG